MQKKQKESRLSIVTSTFSTVLLVLMAYVVINHKISSQQFQQENRSFTDVMADLSIERKEYDEEEMRCLRKAIFFEVRKNIKEEMLVVADVILNRVKHKQYPNSVCKVVLHKGQFEYVMRGLHDPEAVQKTVSKNALEKQSWELAREVAIEALTNPPNITKGAIAYHANTMKKPESRYWKSLTKTVKTDLHTFYK